MSSLNHVYLVGNLTRDPGSRSLSSGTMVADIGIAVNESYKDKDGKFVEKPVFVEVVTWGRQAEACAEHLRKGAPVLVEGKLQLDQWETEGGEKRSKLRVRANRVQFIGARREGEGGGDDAPPNGHGHRSNGKSKPASKRPAAPLAGDDEDMPF